jgi:hypothetical protein
MFKDSGSKTQEKIADLLTTATDRITETRREAED